MSAKILILVMKLVPLAIWGWRRLTLGWRADFAQMPDLKTQQIQHRGATAQVREQCSKLGWPIVAMVQFNLERSWLFELSPQPKVRFSAELEVGIASFDQAFFIGPESRRFAMTLVGRDDLRRHLLLLPARMSRHEAKFMRLGCEGKDLAAQVNVRWTRNRPALYRDLLDWMQALDVLLSTESKAASKPPRTP